MPPSHRGAFSILRHASFTRFMLARMLATLGAQMQTVAVGWQIYAITRDPLDLGLIGLSQFLPFIVLVLPAGQIADHNDRARILSLCYATSTLCAVLLLLFTWHGIHAAWPVFVTMTLLGCARAFSMPSSQALLPNLMPPEEFSRAVALNSSAMQIATVAGPALGGLLYIAGPMVVYATVIACAFTSMLLMAGVRANSSLPRLAEPPGWRALLSGLHFVWSRRIVLGAISLDLFAVLFGGATALLPVFARDILHTGPAGLGLLRTAPGIGAGICALLLAMNPIMNRVGAWMFGGVAAFGLAIVTFGLSTNFVVSLLCLVVLGAGDMVSVYIRHLLVQLETPDEIRGRVSAVSAVFVGASNELGEFESGVTASWWGAVRSVVFGGVVTLVVTGLWARMFPSLWNMKTFPPRNAAR